MFHVFSPKSLKTACTLAMLSATPVLSGCFATMALQNKATQSSTQTISYLSDTITHIGTPKASLKDYPHALVMVGNKQSYVLTSPHQARPSLLKEIFTQVDTSHLYIKPNQSTSPKDHKQSASNRYEIVASKNYCYSQNKLCDTVNLHFQKPTAQLHKGEQTQLKNLGFSCQENKSLLECHQEVGFIIHLANKIPNQNLPHRLKQPIEFHVVGEEYHSKTNKGLMLLTPVAVGIDIVTFPLQFLLASYWLKNK